MNLLPVLLALLGSSAWHDEWPAFRGDGSGTSAARKMPVQWSPDSGIAWKVEIPGKGLSTPIVWKDRVYLTTAIPHGEAIEPSGYHGHDDGAHGNVAPLRAHRFVVPALERRLIRWLEELGK